MKILHFIHGLNTGGAETLVKNYMLNFDKNKNEPVLLCLYHYSDSPYEDELEKNGIKVIYVEDYLPFDRKSNVPKRICNRIYGYFIVRKIIKDESPDILHLHLPLYTYAKFAKPNRKKTLIFDTIHTDPKKVWTDNNGKIRINEFRATKWLLKKYDMRFIVLHEEMRQKINALFKIDNSIVLNNGVNINEYRKKRDRVKIRQSYKIPSDAFLMGHVGRFSKVKNHDFIVRLFKAIKNPDKFLLMVGDGNEKEKIIKKMSDEGLDGKYLILSNRNDIPDIMSMMDVFVFPSFYEGMPTSLIEAQESKLPCFISDTISDDAIISNLVTRLSLDGGVEKWAEVIGSYKKPEKIVINDEDWDIKKITKQLEMIYEEAFAEKRNGK